MRGRTKVQDTADVFFHYANGGTRFFGCMDTASIEKTIDVAPIRCGIGFGIAALLYSNPDMQLTLTPAFWNDYFVEMQAGDDFALASSVNVWTSEKELTAVLASADATVAITGTPVGAIVKVQDKTGKFYPATFATGVVTITGGASLAGQKVTVSYQLAVTGDVLTFKSDNYPVVIGVTLHTIAYDVETNAVVSDLYFKFDKVVGNGALSLGLTGQTNSVTEITATVLPDGNGNFGTYTVVDRP